ncbi:MDR family MFS transporter [Leifsonia sp. McL0607]|uniref:MDR family MFS transporter n=1 Tax=Leifsonia sp. McL0607 TaxID=3415672 RepID=UPI003CF15CC0
MDASSGPQAAPRSVTDKPNIVLVFAGLLLTMLLASLDQTIFSTALPTIVGELHAADEMGWVITIYLLTSTIVLPVYGKLGDLIGRKGIFIAAISIFVVGSTIGGFAPDMTWLIIGRGVQGLGGGGLMILSQAIIADVVPARERGRYMGIMGAVFAVSSVAGPLLGGWLTDAVSWRWCLWVNIPLGILAIIAAAAFLHLQKHPTAAVRLDVYGIGLLALASTGLILVSTWGGTTYDWDSPLIILLIVATAIAAIVFVLVERRTPEPIMPLKLFRRRNFNLSTGAGLLIGVAMFGTIAYTPTYLQMVTGVNATQAGLLMVPMMAALLVSSVASGQIVSRTGRYKWAPIAGTLTTAVGLFLLSTMSATTAVWVTCLYLAVMGLGLGLCMQNLILVVQNTFPNSMVGTATATNNYFRQIGSSLGAAIVGTVFTSRLADLLTQRLSAGGSAAAGASNEFTPGSVKHLPAAIRDIIVASYADALTPIFLAMVPLMVVATLLVVFLREVPLRTTIDHSDVIADSLEIDGSNAVALTTAELAIISAAQRNEDRGRAVSTE